MTTVYNLRNYGAVNSGVNDAVLAANNNAIATAVGLIASSSRGGYITWDGAIYVNQPISSPTNGGYPVPFGIIGDDVSTKLINAGTGWSISIDGANAEANGNLSRQVVRGLSIISPSGRGIYVTDAGLSLNLEDVDIQAGATGLYINRCHGGKLSQVVINSGDFGLVIENTEHFMFTGLSIKHTRFDGFTANNCGSLYGRIRTVYNSRYGLNLNGVTDSRLNIHLRNNGRYKSDNQFQAKRRNCRRNYFTGYTARDTNLGWNEDYISHIANFDYLAKQENDWIYLPANNVSNLSGNVTGWNNLITSTYINSDTNRIVINAQTWNTGIVTTNKYVEFLAPGGNLASVAYAAGDWINITANISGEPGFLSYAATQLSSGNPISIMSWQLGSGTPVAQDLRFINNSEKSYWATTDGNSPMDLMIQAGQAGSNIRPILRLNMPSGVGPSSNITLYISNFGVRVIPSLPQMNSGYTQR